MQLKYTMTSLLFMPYILFLHLIDIFYCTFHFLFDFFVLLFSNGLHASGEGERERLCFNQLKNSPAGQQALLQVYLLII